MATFNEHIQVVIDVVTNKATAGLKDFRSAVTEAQGFTGKLKAGVGALKDQFAAAATSPAGLTAAVTAGATIAAQAVTEYARLGVQIGDFATATGLATEDASRWVEVAGDLNIDAGTLQASIGKLNKTIDPKLFADLGIEISRTSDGAVDVNGTFLNVIDRLRAIKDPAEQARVGAQLLGKGWQSVAPLISRSAGEIRDRLADVADVKVFNDKDKEKARQFEAAMNDLQDAAQELALRLGQELLPVVTQIAGPIADLAGAFGDAKDAMGDWGMSGLEAFNKLSDAGAEFIDWIRGVPEPIQYTGEAITTMGDSAAQSARYLGLLSEHTRESANATIDLTGNARLARAQLKLLQDQIEGRKSFIDLQIQLRENAKRIKEVADDFDAGKISAEEYYTGVASASLDSQAALADYLAVTDEIPETVKTEILAEFDPLNPQKAWQDIQSYFDSHTIQVTTETDRENRRPNGGTPTTTSGGGGQGGVGYMKENVGGFGRGGATVTVNVNAPVGANLVEAGRQVADALRAYYNNGGEPV